MPIIKCPSCGCTTVQMTDHLPIHFNTMPHETELYARFQCLSVGCHKSFSTVLDITYNQKHADQDLVDRITSGMPDVFNADDGREREAVIRAMLESPEIFKVINQLIKQSIQKK